MIQVEVSKDLERLVRSLDLSKAKHLPYVMARGLTDTAEDIRIDTLRRLPRVFTLRNQYVKRGIRKTAATKQDFTAEVGSVTPFMEKQADGGTKKPKAKYVPVPVGARRSWPAIASPLPSKLSNDPKSFVADMGGGRLGVFKRKGKKRLPIALMYSLVPSADIKPEWQFKRDAERTADERLERHFMRRLKDAI